MTKRVLVYFIALLLVWSAQASAFKLTYDSDDRLHKVDGIHSTSHGLITAVLNNVHLNGHFNRDRNDQFKWLNSHKELPISILDVVFKGRDFNLPEKGDFLNKHRGHTPAPVPEPATLLLLGIGVITIISRTSNRIKN